MTVIVLKGDQLAVDRQAVEGGGATCVRWIGGRGL
jgi:hypothetical protein